MASTYTYPVESYAWIINLDESVLKLNPALESFGYKFISVGLKQLETDFSDLFGFAPGFKSESVYTISHINGEIDSDSKNFRKAIEEERAKRIAEGIPIEEIETTISGEFYDLLLYNAFDAHDLLERRKLVLLKKVYDFENEIINNTTTFGLPIKVLNEMGDFVRLLIQQFRLFKNGDVMCKIQFQVAANTRKIIQRFNPRFSPGGMSKFIITDEEVNKFRNQLDSSFRVNQLCEFALSNFNVAYEISEIKSKYLTLISCIESLFNTKSGETAHTVSRHLALMISDTEKDFEKNYDRVRQLFKTRNLIIHGGSVNENMKKITDELQDFARVAINKCLKYEKTKDDLFEHLNKAGFINYNTKTGTT